MPDIEVKNTFVTNDLSLAAYFRMKGVTLLQTRKLGRSYQFVFEATSDIDRLKMSFVHSESSRFDDEVRKLKKILFSES